METLKIIGRISKEGKEYLQMAINEEGKEGRFIPVYLKHGVEKLNFISQEKKVDKRGTVYTLYVVEKKNVFMPIDNDEKIVKKAIITA